MHLKTHVNLTFILNNCSLTQYREAKSLLYALTRTVNVASMRKETWRLIFVHMQERNHTFATWKVVVKRFRLRDILTIIWISTNREKRNQRYRLVKPLKQQDKWKNEKACQLRSKILKKNQVKIRKVKFIFVIRNLEISSFVKSGQLKRPRFCF